MLLGKGDVKVGGCGFVPSSIEFLFVWICISNHMVLMEMVYRPPRRVQSTGSNLCKKTLTLISRHHNVILMGDFNHIISIPCLSLEIGNYW